MEVLLALLAFCFVVLPFPLCIYLLIQKNRLSERLAALERAQTPVAAPAPELNSASEISEAPVSPKPAEPPPSHWPEHEAEPAYTAPDLALESAALAPPEATRAEATRPGADRIRNFLRAVGFLPPADLELREAGLIQWWAPRVGGLLAVLTIVFFSVYISNRISPAIRFFQLVAADALVLALGAYFWNRRRRFGSTLLSAGMSMLYVTVVAGFAAAPVRVFENALLGIALQFATIAGIYATSLFTRERGIALLATIFGYASSGFSAYLGYDEAALISALSLQLAGVYCAYRFRYAALAGIALLGVYLPLAAFCALHLIRSESFTLPHLYSVIAFLAFAVSTLPFMARCTRLSELFPGRSWRWIVMANTTLCAAVGFLYVKLSGGDLVWFYGPTALVFLFWAAAFLRSGLDGLLFQLFFLKGSGLAALWLANYFTGEIRWFALAIECVLVAWSTRRSRSGWSESATFALWLAALWLALGDLAGTGRLGLWSLPWAFYSMLPLLGAAALSLQLAGLARGSKRTRSTR